MEMLVAMTEKVFETGAWKLMMTRTLVDFGPFHGSQRLGCKVADSALTLARLVGSLYVTVYVNVHVVDVHYLNPTPFFRASMTTLRHLPTASKSPSNVICPRSELTTPPRTVR